MCLHNLVVLLLTSCPFSVSSSILRVVTLRASAGLDPLALTLWSRLVDCFVARSSLLCSNVFLWPLFFAAMFANANLAIHPRAAAETFLLIDRLLSLKFLSSRCIHWWCVCFGGKLPAVCSTFVHDFASGLCFPLSNQNCN